jgi:alkanesulfonate monooxygenase SsuD/methylene tetrahydromethanopterin reductase-like flavin-dependent oxidoreductase (luciferase family)
MPGQTSPAEIFWLIGSAARATRRAAWPPSMSMCICRGVSGRRRSRGKFADIRRQAEAHGRQVRFGLRAHITVRETEEEAWRKAHAGAETFILSGYPHLEEAYRTAELLFPAIAKSSPVFQTVQQAVESTTARAGSPAVGRFSSI